MAKTEVRAELKLDDLASATLSKIQGGFGKLDSAVSGATRHMLDFAKQTAAVAVGVNLGNIFGGVKDLATSAFRESVKADDQMKLLSRTMAGLSAVRGKDMLAFRRDAQGVYEKLTAIGRASGVAREDLVQAFSQAGANTKRTSTQLEDLIGKAAGASRALGVPVQEVVQGFMEVEKNVVSANNPIIAMVKQANLMRGHSEQIALRFQFMSKWAKEKLAQKALEAMAAKAKEIPLTFAEMGEQLAELKTDTLKIVGAPMAQALRPVFESFTKFLGENREGIAQYARMMGEKAKEWILDAAEAAKEGFKYLQTHAEEIKNAIKTGFDYAKAIFKWMIEHKGLIAGAFIAGKAAPAVGAIGGGVAQFSKAIVDVAREGIPALGLASSAAAAGLTGMAITLGAFALAVGGTMLAVDQFRRLMGETNEAEQNQTARTDALSGYAADFKQWDKTTIAAFDDLKQKIVDNARKLGQDSRAAGEAVEKAYQQHLALSRATEGMQLAAGATAKLPTDESKMNEEQLYQSAKIQSAASIEFSQSMQQAAANGNKAAIEAGVTILRGSTSLQQALLKSGALSAEELEKLADLLGDKVGDLGKKLREQAGFAGEAKATTEKGAVPLNVFNGGQTFQIKQDFRDQDPDRIAAIFSRDLSLAAENRTMARTSLPFGG